MRLAVYTDCYSDKLPRRHKQTNGQGNTFVCLSVVSVKGVRHVGGRSAMLYRNLRGGDKNPGSANKYTKFGQLIIRKIIKYCHQLSHFKAKMH